LFAAQYVLKGPEMKICLIGSFPPSGRQLNEYSYHLAREVQQNPLISLTIIADDPHGCTWATDARGVVIEPQGELPDFDVVRCWQFNSASNPARLLKVIRQLRPDIVWFNLVFSTFGTPEHPIAAFLGLCTPALTRMAGFYTHVTLHHIMEHVDFSAGGIQRAKGLFRYASKVATKMLLAANSVSVLLPAYRRTLIEKYWAENVHFHPHGTLGTTPEYPDFSQRGNPNQRVLAIGHWGTYKRLETVVEAFAEVSRRVPNAKLVIAGANHHTCPGYWESIRESQKGNPALIFRGYVPEDEIPDLYRTSSIVVLPYNSSTGSSGPAHQACQYGVPIVSADIPEFHNMAEEEGIAVEFYERGNSKMLADRLIAILESPERQLTMAEQNYSAALRMTMPQVIRRYLRSFDVHRRTRAIAPILRFRRIPPWIPVRSTIFRALAPRWPQ
jgi:glycosyltransferase involved in cell wall biosynthesis